MPVSLCWPLNCLIIIYLSTPLPDPKRENIDDVDTKEFLRNLCKQRLGRRIKILIKVPIFVNVHAH